MAQHYPFENLKGKEQGLLEPLYKRTCVFIELTSYPKAFKWRHLWFPEYLFGTSRPGIICVIDDWLELSRDVEAYRGNRQERVRSVEKGDARSLAARVLEFEDDEF
jgi:hypothetical protein